MRLNRKRLEGLRDRLQRRGQRPSMILGVTKPDVIEAAAIVEEYGPMCEALYLVMAADRRVLNVEREVTRGALDVLSGGRVRTVHMEAMLDAAARASGEDGEAKRLDEVIAQLADDPVRAEITVLLCAAVAAADGRVTPEEHRILSLLAEKLGVKEARAEELLDELG